MLIRLLLIAVAATALAQTESFAAIGLSALPLAILMGITYGNVAQPENKGRDAAVLAFSQQKLLRLGIILFGFNLSFQQIAAVGYQAILLDMIVIAVVLSLGIFVGIRLFRLPREVAILTSVGSAICGAAAIMATEPVIRAKERDVTVAVATVVLFGTLAMFSYPVIYSFVGMDPSLFGIYIGSTVHEVAQAVAAGQSIGGEAMQNAVVAKLIRVMLLAPVVIALGSLYFRQASDSGERRPVPIPWFVFGFIATAALNSVLMLPAIVLEGLQLASQLSLAIAMAALGIKTRWATIRQAGIKPLALSLVLFVVLMLGGFGLNVLFYG
ncbi:YeiH family protein [Marinobacterium rhizophilum]|uniref:YeiH family putative sulfate export transporter n=1 Tax=Marinobacterium rhizophilum TaxID=420402 RepID=A0ABY5HG98_9GAMM|nr:YeiH family protein [Marinobacterium rhizophilum]UTW11385.1 YeiH family putative sulfate export transporter [Marinobacterium rhizophilum]